MLIDGVDIGSINLQEARRCMAVITQDPVLFGGTLKRNIDPFSEYSDQDLWTALEEVQLKKLVAELPGQLEFKLKECGTNLSVGDGSQCAWLVHWSRRARSSSWMKPPLMWISGLIV